MTREVIDPVRPPRQGRRHHLPTAVIDLEVPMPAYAIASLRTVDVNDEIVEYLEKIDASLDPFDGRFLVHGSTPEVIDGDLPGAVVVIEFPDLAAAHAWYHSPAYQEILPLRLRNSTGGAVIVDGAPEGYRAAHYAAKLLAL
jgi:uncharacterized protein (DUF1330 family)